MLTVHLLEGSEELEGEPLLLDESQVRVRVKSDTGSVWITARAVLCASTCRRGCMQKIGARDTLPGTDTHTHIHHTYTTHTHTPHIHHTYTHSTVPLHTHTHTFSRLHRNSVCVNTCTHPGRLLQSVQGYHSRLTVQLELVAQSGTDGSECLHAKS